MTTAIETLLKFDNDLSTVALSRKYCFTDEHPVYTRELWVKEACPAATDLPYWQWVSYQVQKALTCLGMAADEAVIREDHGLSAEALQDKYTAKEGNEHPLFTEIEWANNALAGYTHLGYWQWVAQQLDRTFRLTGAVERCTEAATETDRKISQLLEEFYGQAIAEKNEPSDRIQLAQLMEKIGDRIVTTLADQALADSPIDRLNRSIAEINTRNVVLCAVRAFYRKRCADDPRYASITL